MGLVRWLIGRGLRAASTLLGVATIAFVLLRVVGDPLAGLVPPGSAREDVAALRRAYGLDRPLPEQYLAFVIGAAPGDFAASWREGAPAAGRAGAPSGRRGGGGGRRWGRRWSGCRRRWHWSVRQPSSRPAAELSGGLPP